MDGTRDLTKGKVSGLLLSFFFPMLSTNLLQQLYAFADAAIVGKGLGDDALGAVGNLSSMWLLIIGFSVGMTNGFSVVIAQRCGTGDAAALRRAIALSIKLSLVLSALLTAAGCLLLEPALFAMRTAEPIFRDSLLYGGIIFRGLAVTIAYNHSSGILRAFGDSRTPFVALAISSALNVALDCATIFWLKMGVEGAALSTVLSQMVSAFICCRRIRAIRRARLCREDFENDAAVCRALLRNGAAMACMNSVTAVGCMVAQGYVNGIGASCTSAYSACNKYLNLFMLPAVTAGFAISAFAGQNYGAGEVGRIREGMRVCCAIALAAYLALGPAMCLLPRMLAELLLSGEETIALAVEYLRICGAALVLLNLLFIVRSCVQGMGYPLLPMCSGALEMALRISAIALLLPAIGFRATAWAEVAAWTGALALNWIAYVRIMRKNRKDPPPDLREDESFVAQ